MKAEALSVQECAWSSEERRQQAEDPEDSHRDGLCLPNLFRSKKVKPLMKIQTGPTYQTYHTAKELLLEVLDKAAVRKLSRRAAGAKAGARSQSREQSLDLSEAEYVEAITWISIVLQSGLSVGGGSSLGSELPLKLDGWHGVLKRNSFHSNLVSLSRLEDGDKLEVLSAFCSHITGRYQALYTPGTNLAVKKYSLSSPQGTCSLHLAVLCDLSSGFICNTFLFVPEQLQRQSRKAVVEQVVGCLLRPFCSQRPPVHVDSSAWGEDTNITSGLGFGTSEKKTPGDPSSHLLAHLPGWTGPALFPLLDLKVSETDVLVPGLWAALHVVCINTFILHTLQSSGSGRQVQLTEFSRTLAAQLAVESSVTVPVLKQLNSTSCQEASFTNQGQQRPSSSGGRTDGEQRGCGSVEKLQAWNKPGVCGLENSGNSCYLNAVLQCLCSTVPLVEHLLNQDTRKTLARSRCRLAEVFVRLLQEMWLGRSSSCAPVEARSVLASILPQFNNYCQQDAQELLLFLLNALHEDLKKVAKPQVRCSVHQQRKEEKKTSLAAAAAGESTILSLLFEGELSYVTLCMHCDLQAHSTQTFTMLSLPIPAGITSCSIQDCLSLFFQQTVLTGGEQMLCSVCGLRRETTVLTCLEKAPEILMLHLKRFGCKGRNQVKLKTNVVFSMKLDLNPFLPGEGRSSSYSSYRLYAVVNHSGRLSMGHYTAVCHSPLTRTWHCFDDSDVRELQEGQVQSSNAYVLLYSRRHFQRPKIHGL